MQWFDDDTGAGWRCLSCGTVVDAFSLATQPNVNLRRAPDAPPPTLPKRSVARRAWLGLVVLALMIPRPADAQSQERLQPEPTTLSIRYAKIGRAHV